MTIHAPLTATAIAGTATAFTILPSRGHSAEKDRIVVAHWQEPVQYNPLLYVNRGTENGPEAAMFDALWDMNNEGKFVPNLATEVPTRENRRISEDGEVWKIELKPGVKWHDGAPFTAKDVEFTYQTIMNPKVADRPAGAALEQERGGEGDRQRMAWDAADGPDPVALGICGEPGAKRVIFRLISIIEARTLDIEEAGGLPAMINGPDARIADTHSTERYP